MKKSNIVFLFMLLAVLLFIGQDAQAQVLEDIGFVDDVNDEPQTPIFGHLFLMLSLAIGSLIGLVKITKK